MRRDLMCVGSMGSLQVAFHLGGNFAWEPQAIGTIGNEGTYLATRGQSKTRQAHDQCKGQTASREGHYYCAGTVHNYVFEFGFELELELEYFYSGASVTEHRSLQLSRRCLISPRSTTYRGTHLTYRPHMCVPYLLGL